MSNKLTETRKIETLNKTLDTLEIAITKNHQKNEQGFLKNNSSII